MQIGNDNARANLLPPTRAAGVMGSLHEIPSSLYLPALPHQPHSAQSDAGMTCVEGLLFYFLFFRLSVSAIKLSTVTASLKLQSTGLEEGAGKRCLESNFKHWFTTSFRLGGRCRKAMLGVWRGVCLLLRPSTSRPLQIVSPCTVKLSEVTPSPTPLPLSASSDRQSLYSQAVRGDPPPPPRPLQIVNPCTVKLSEMTPPPPPPTPSPLALFRTSIPVQSSCQRSPPARPFHSRPLQIVNLCTVKLSEIPPPPPPTHTQLLSFSLLLLFLKKCQELDSFTMNMQH